MLSTLQSLDRRLDLVLESPAILQAPVKERPRIVRGFDTWLEDNGVATYIPKDTLQTLWEDRIKIVVRSQHGVAFLNETLVDTNAIRSALENDEDNTFLDCYAGKKHVLNRKKDATGIFILWRHPDRVNMYAMGATETELSFIRFSAGMRKIWDCFGYLSNVHDLVHVLRYFDSNFNDMKHVTNIPETYTYKVDSLDEMEQIAYAHDARRALDQRREDSALPDDASVQAVEGYTSLEDEEGRPYVYLSDRLRDDREFWAMSLAAFFPTATTSQKPPANTYLEYLKESNPGWTACSTFTLDGHAIAAMYKPAGAGISAYCIVCHN